MMMMMIYFHGDLRRGSTNVIVMHVFTGGQNKTIMPHCLCLNYKDVDRMNENRGEAWMVAMATQYQAEINS